MLRMDYDRLLKVVDEVALDISSMEEDVAGLDANELIKWEGADREEMYENGSRQV